MGRSESSRRTGRQPENNLQQADFAAPLVEIEQNNRNHNRLRRSPVRWPGTQWMIAPRPMRPDSRQQCQVNWVTEATPARHGGKGRRHFGVSRAVSGGLARCGRKLSAVAPGAGRCSSGPKHASGNNLRANRCSGWSASRLIRGPCARDASHRPRRGCHTGRKAMRPTKASTPPARLW